MDKKKAERILCEVLSLPTAPFAEHHVLDYIRSFVDERSTLSLRQDAAGNLLVRFRHGAKQVPRPVCLTAHVDHPGFVADRMISSTKLRARWFGGVQPKYVPGAKVRFHSDGEWVHGKVTSMSTARRGTRTVLTGATVGVTRRVSTNSPGMWDFPDPRLRNGRVYARACDDLAGAAAMLASLDDLHNRRPAGDAYFLFTRAEEVGFIGAMAACRLKTLPARAVVIAVENSSELPHAKMGDGPILRVGDRESTFSSPATAFCAAVAADEVKRNKRFKFQRRLMDGGMCESSAYCLLGYDATGVCIALGHYHNMNTKTGKLAAEYIDVNDFMMLARWFVALVETKRRYTGEDPNLKSRLDRLRKEYNPLLRRTAPPKSRKTARR